MKPIPALLALTMTASLGLASMSPAKADGAASTRNILLGAAALGAGLIIENNIARKHRQAVTVSGYTPGGATVYGDGRVVLPNGTSYYPGNYGERVACSNNQCYVNNVSGSDPYAWQLSGRRNLTTQSAYYGQQRRDAREDNREGNER